MAVTLLVAPGISSCTAYFEKYHAQGLCHRLITPYCRALAAPLLPQDYACLNAQHRPGFSFHRQLQGGSKAPPQQYLLDSDSEHTQEGSPSDTQCNYMLPDDTKLAFVFGQTSNSNGEKSRRMSQDPSYSKLQASSSALGVGPPSALFSNSRSNGRQGPSSVAHLSPTVSASCAGTLADMMRLLAPLQGQVLVLLLQVVGSKEQVTLERLMRRGGLYCRGSKPDLVMVWEALQMVGMVATALAHLHQQGITHGCLRCSNVLIRPRVDNKGYRFWAASLTDIGLSTLACHPSDGPPLPLASLADPVFATQSSRSDHIQPAASSSLYPSRSSPHGPGGPQPLHSSASLARDVYDFGQLFRRVLFPGSWYCGVGLPPAQGVYAMCSRGLPYRLILGLSTLTTLYYIFKKSF